jgi:hypothetical protein
MRNLDAAAATKDAPRTIIAARADSAQAECVPL